VSEVWEGGSLELELGLWRGSEVGGDVVIFVVVVEEERAPDFLFDEEGGIGGGGTESSFRSSTLLFAPAFIDFIWVLRGLNATK